jgi:molecular chaperone GrpE
MSKVKIHNITDVPQPPVVEQGEEQMPAGPSVEAPAAVAEAAPAEALQNELREARERAARIQAEFENYRKRTQREQEEFRDYALAEAVKQLLPILDSLDGAAKNEKSTVEDYAKGVELIDKQLRSVLAKLGVEPIPAEGQKFDPNLHQAIQVVASDTVAEDHVVSELLRGFRIKNRVLRPAMVTVAQKPA